jgi:hypothetical protein
MLCNEILYVLGREMTGGLADEGPALFNYAAAFLDEDNTVTAKTKAAIGEQKKFSALLKMLRAGLA